MSANVCISVIVPTYNRPTQTREALESVFAQDCETQDCTDLEVIVVDDGSSPALDAALFEGSPIASHLIRLEKQLGVAAARNKGIAMARGQWLAFLDSDDTWMKQKLSSQLSYLRNNPACKIVQTQEQWVRNGVKVNQPKHWAKQEGDLFMPSLERCMISPSSVLIHRSVFDEVGLFNESFVACEDYDLWLRITRLYNIGLVDTKLMTRYAGASDQLSTTVPLQDRYRIESLSMILDNDLGEERRAAVQKTLTKKLLIIVQGMQKRGNEVEAGLLLEKYDQYRV